jgi:RNA polymerase sigma-70 factor (ECF subfamily)
MNEDLALAFKEVTGMDFDNFYKKYRPKLVYYLTKYTKCQEKSEDFADDAFIQALLKIRNYNSDKSQIHTWIYKIGENLVIKEFKDNQRFSTVSIDKNNDDNLNISNLLVCDYEKELEKEMVLQSKTNVIYDAILKLPPKYRTVMEMREIKKMSYVAISEACVSEFEFEIDGYKTMPHPKEFLDIKVLNTSNKKCNN